MGGSGGGALRLDSRAIGKGHMIYLSPGRIRTRAVNYLSIILSDYNPSLWRWDYNLQLSCLRWSDLGQQLYWFQK